MGYDALGPGLAGATKEMVMLKGYNFEVIIGSDAQAGSLVQSKGSWFLAVGDSAFLLLSGNRRGLIVNMPDQYMLLIRKMGSVEVRFLDAIKATSPVPNMAGPGSIIVFTDNGLRFAGAYEGEPLRLFTEDGDLVQEEPRISAHDFALYVQLMGGGEVKVI
ncbi:hypothetical protein MOQ50_11290 [Stenotrophomonas maltophilia]|nr:hypothetical protein [Stenotrophomonas maltophilia]